MAHKKISLKGLADYMTASHTRQRSVLRQYKYPEEDEAQAKIIYYREARERVAVLHRSDRDSAWLLQQAAQLDTLAAMSTGQTKTRLRHNARGLRAYASHFADRSFEILDDVRFALRFGDVMVSTVPDLHVKEKNKEKLVKLEFSATEPSPVAIQVISQAMFEAAEQANLGLPSSGVLYLDVPRGVAHKGARLGSRMRKDIESACLSISAIWDTLE
jgi:hypothetical protein